MKEQKTNKKIGHQPNAETIKALKESRKLDLSKAISGKEALKRLDKESNQAGRLVKKRIPKPVKTLAVETVLRYWRAIEAGKEAPVFTGKDRPKLDPAKTSETNRLFLEALRERAKGKGTPTKTKKQVDKALRAWRLIASEDQRSLRGIGFYLASEGEERDFNETYLATLMRDLLQAYSEVLTGASKGKCNIDAFLGVCPRCEKIFEKKREDQLYDRDTCRNESARKK